MLVLRIPDLALDVAGQEVHGDALGGQFGFLPLREVSVACPSRVSTQPLGAEPVIRRALPMSESWEAERFEQRPVPHSTWS